MVPIVEKKESAPLFGSLVRQLTSLFDRGISAGNIAYSGVLRKKAQYRRSIRTFRSLNLPRHIDRPKNWDGLAAYCIVCKFFPGRSSRILDAGGEYYSPILMQLELSGYTDLTCINLVFKDRFTAPFLKKGNIRFEYGDITKTRFAAASFDAITCLSVIEHGVDVDKYLAEMARILKPGGILFTSADYWQQPVDTSGKCAYGGPIRIFTSADMERIVATAESCGLELLMPLELECGDRVVSWDEFGLRYTFIYFTLRKK
jgi:SAM-dependent methyltransferase